MLILAESGLRRTQRGGGEVVLVHLSGARRRFGADVLRGAGVRSELERSVRQLRAVRRSGTGGRRGDIGRDVGHDPVPETATGRGLRVVHRDDEALGLGGEARPRQLR
jgi:hypothetical protein